MQNYKKMLDGFSPLCFSFFFFKGIIIASLDDIGTLWCW